jgi:7-keto-8-aminopelargonate synthetase-like enzyme
LNYILQKRQGCKAMVDGKSVTIFSSNDYLGLSAHPEVLQAAALASQSFGTGTGGAPGTTGTTIIHEQLKAAVAKFKSREKAVLFPSGYQANQAIHQALGGESAVYHIDSRHHPSAIDGVRLAHRSEIVRFEHQDLDTLEKSLKIHRQMTNIVSLPSVFTVDGDLAPLDKLFVLKKKYGFLLIIDEAHASGCIGDRGHGLEEHFNLKGSADFVMGTFSKALGSQGGFLAFNEDVEKYLNGQFRTFEYSTSLSTVSAAAALKSCELIEKDDSLIQALRHSKSRIIEEFQSLSVPLVHGESMIMLLPAPNIERLQGRLIDDGYLTIPVNAILDGKLQPCLRITPMATHKEEDIRGFAGVLKKHFE